MAIQQSINQLIASGAVATALYAHQPGVQKKRAEDAEYKALNKSYDPQTTTTATGRQGIAVERALQKGGATADEAEWETLPYAEKELEEMKRLAELEKDPEKQKELYENVGHSYNAIWVKKQQHSGLANAVQVGTEQLQSQLTTQDYIDGILNKAKDTPGFGSRKMKKLKKQLKRLEDDE